MVNFWGTLWLFFVQDPASNSWIEERNHPQPKRDINEWVERCGTEEVLRKSSTNFQWDVSPGASGPYKLHIWKKDVLRRLNKDRGTNGRQFSASNRMPISESYILCSFKRLIQSMIFHRAKLTHWPNQIWTVPLEDAKVKSLLQQLIFGLLSLVFGL